MKKLFIIIVLITGLITFAHAQGITNTLGGNTASDKFVIENKSSEVGLVVTGEGNVGIGITNPSNKLHIIHNGDNPGLAVNQSGEGNSSVFTIDNTGNSAAALEASSNGTGHVIQARHFGLEGNAGGFRIDNAGNSNVALYARTDGDGPALGGNNMGNGIAGFFNIIDSNNDKTALEVKTNGIGFQQAYSKLIIAVIPKPP